ncbi:MAG TPA: radical SAM family heme chaperone HemW [Terriglobales bacterium]|nr:radical SAM family heme chaperone HemW [Terriglobales bacterium]
MPIGLYIAVPFCRTKCSYCNFASNVFSKGAFETYVARVLEDIRGARAVAAELGATLEETADSVYLGGGTPSILEPSQLVRIFEAARGEFALRADAEITVECAPGTLSPALIETLVQCDVNRVSLGVQSFVDQEAQSVGRLHKRSTVLEEIARLRAAGIVNINIDLIAGLPHQTAASWKYSLAETIATAVPHVSVYMLEVDEDSRLGRELIAGGARYHAHFVPDEDATADFYLQACETLNAAGIPQYEISNFARAGAQSRHNLKYWTREPYLGFGVDAHSMLRVTSAAKADAGKTVFDAALKLCSTQTQNRTLVERSSALEFEAVRFSTPDSLDAYMNRGALAVTTVSARAALEESFFLGLRLNRGVDLENLRAEFGAERLTECDSAIAECEREGLLEKCGTRVRLTARGRLLSNEVFARFLADEKAVGTGHVNPR